MSVDRTSEERCPHGIRWPHPCRECEDAPLPSKAKLYQLADPENDLFSDAMDRAVSAHHSVMHGAMRNAERAGEGSTMDGEKIARRALASGIKAYLEEIGPHTPETGVTLELLRQIRDKLGRVAPADFRSSSGEVLRAVEAAYYLADNALFEADRRATPAPAPKATERYIDLHAVMWAEVKEAIVKAPRFQEMYAAGGTLNDGISSTVALLMEPHAPKVSEPLPTPIVEDTRPTRFTCGTCEKAIKSMAFWCSDTCCPFKEGADRV